MVMGEKLKNAAITHKFASFKTTNSVDKVCTVDLPLKHRFLREEESRRLEIALWAKLR